MPMPSTFFLNDSGSITMVTISPFHIATVAIVSSYTFGYACHHGKTEGTSMEMMSYFCSFVQTRVTKLNKSKVVSLKQNHLTRTVFR